MKNNDTFLVGSASRLIKEASLMLQHCTSKTRESYLPLNEETDISVNGICLNLDEFENALKHLHAEIDIPRSSTRLP